MTWEYSKDRRDCHYDRHDDRRHPNDPNDRRHPSDPNDRRHPSDPNDRRLPLRPKVRYCMDQRNRQYLYPSPNYDNIANNNPEPVHGLNW